MEGNWAAMFGRVYFVCYEFVAGNWRVRGVDMGEVGSGSSKMRGFFAPLRMTGEGLGVKSVSPPMCHEAPGLKRVMKKCLAGKKAYLSGKSRVDFAALAARLKPCP